MQLKKKFNIKTKVDFIDHSVLNESNNNTPDIKVDDPNDEEINDYENSKLKEELTQKIDADKNIESKKNEDNVSDVSKDKKQTDNSIELTSTEDNISQIKVDKILESENIKEDIKDIIIEHSELEDTPNEISSDHTHLNEITENKILDNLEEGKDFGNGKDTEAENPEDITTKTKPKSNHLYWIVPVLLISTLITFYYNSNIFSGYNKEKHTKINNIVKIPETFQGKIKGKTRRVTILNQEKKDEIIDFNYSVIGSYSEKDKKGNINFSKKEAYFETIGIGTVSTENNEITIKFESNQSVITSIN